MQKVFRLSPIGPNRRADSPVVELLLAFDPEEAASIALEIGPALSRLREALPGLTLAIEADEAHTRQPLQPFSAACVALALTLQRYSGHAVSRSKVLQREDPHEAHFWFEHEEVEVGEYAIELAMCLLSQVLSGLRWTSGFLDHQASARQLLADFDEFARPRALPPDTAAICAAAARLHVPCIKLDREPYQGVQGDFRVRPNGMLMIGHGRYRHLVDGTICVERSAQVLPIRSNEAALSAQLHDLLPGACIVPPTVEQPSATLLVAGDQSFLVTAGAAVHDSCHELAVRCAQRLGVGLMSFTVQAEDLGTPVSGTVLRVTGIDPAPRLDRLLAADSLDKAAVQFVRWLFPESSTSRLPVVAVTGTNGKTTTSRMADRILQHAGHRTSLKCSDGLYIHNELLTFDGANRPDLYFLPLERPDVDAVVQEMHFGRIARQGFPWLFCDVGICTNVTTDHIGRLGADDLDGMAEFKRAVVERARTAAVLNFDDERCRAMMPHLSAKRVWLISDTYSAGEIREAAGPDHAIAVTEDADGTESIVFYDDGREVLMALDDIPATFSGTARFNVRNAMQAACAGRALGVAPEAIREALSTFRTDMDMGLGRMNIYDGHPFRVILDFAHNADGIRQVGEFLRRQNIKGRKIMLLAAAGERQEVDIREKGQAAAEYFDHFVVRPYPDPRGREPREIVDYMSKFIIEGGANESAITRVFDSNEGILETLRIARPGDWLVMNWGNGEAQHMWDMITAFEPE